MFLASSVLDVEQGGRPQKCVDVSTCLKESGLQFPKKIHEVKTKYTNTSRSRQQDAYTRTVDINEKYIRK
jgi:hypothetical protein